VELTMNLAIEVNNLRKAYGEVKAVDDLSFEVAQGEILGLLGPNGAGKTTTVECLLGLRLPDSGTIRLLGVENGFDTQSIRARLGVQLQSTGLLPQLTVGEQLQLFGDLYPNAISPKLALSLVGLQEKATTPTKALSGGQQQRLAVALALVNHPDLVFLDEPTTGLDPQARRSLWGVISDLRSHGKSVLLTTHYMEEASFLCDRVAIIDHGQIIEHGAPQTLIHKHFRESALEFSMVDAVEQELLTRLSGVTQALFENGFSTLYTTDVPRTISAMYDLITAGTLAFDDLVVRQATLEDVFLKLTGRRIRS
jgi:ABC-2 type transport system ATP-binding protein